MTRAVTYKLIFSIIIAWKVSFSVALTGENLSIIPVSGLQPPVPMREFRGVWIATVQNLDWPSKPGLPAETQKKELENLVQHAAQSRLNAVLLQVRAVGDAFYPSRYEPWSEWLTGQQGKTPGYDPLQEAIRLCRVRGLELHAWFNPFRAGYVGSKGRLSDRHISRLRPSWVRTYGGHLWLDPGIPQVKELLLRSLLDVVERYDLDGIHLDDYFYPAPEKDVKGTALAFPDADLWGQYTSQGGPLGHEDWRRENINRFIQDLYLQVKRIKPWVKVGISPRGIWQPGHPKGIKGFNAYRDIYADSRLWLDQGWVDYFSPQLYWSIGKADQSFPALMHWWDDQNRLNRHVWPGLATYRLEKEWGAMEIIHQIQRTRLRNTSHGHLHFRAQNVLDTDGSSGFSQIKSALYGDIALVPASPWMEATKTKPGKTVLRKNKLENGVLELQWTLEDGEAPRWWLYQTQLDSKWRNRVIPGKQNQARLDLSKMDKIPKHLSWTPLDAYGNLGEPLVLRLERRP